MVDYKVRNVRDVYSSVFESEVGQYPVSNVSAVTAVRTLELPIHKFWDFSKLVQDMLADDVHDDSGTFFEPFFASFA